MQTGHELFIHELQDLLDAEQQLVEALGEQAEESSRPVERGREAFTTRHERDVELSSA